MAKGSDASELLWHYVTVLLSKKQILACPSHSLLGHPPISVVVEGILSQIIYKKLKQFFVSTVLRRSQTGIFQRRQLYCEHPVIL